MDLRTQTSLLAAIGCSVIAARVLLITRKRRVHWFFGLFALTVGAWYISTFLLRFLEGGLFLERLNLVCAVLLPLSAVHFFRTFLQPQSRRATQLQRGALLFAMGMIAAVFTPLYHAPGFAGLIFAYVFVLLAAALFMVYRASQTSRSRFEGDRLRYLAAAGTLAAAFTLAEYLPYAGFEVAPVGTVFILVLLYVLSQSILRFRLVGLYELAARLTFLTALSFSLAGILWVLVALDPGHFFLHSVVAALVLFELVSDPLTAKLEQQINQIFLRERYDLEHVLHRMRRRLAHSLELPDMTQVVIRGLESVRRITHAAIYLVDETGRGYDLAEHLGQEPAARIEAALARPFLDRIRRDGFLVVETMERELEEARELGEQREAENLAEILQTLTSIKASVCLVLRGDDDVYGFLAVCDDRLRDAFSPEEVSLLRGLAAQASIAVENSRLYQTLKQRDRLATLGEMAAGLAHEIRNPLGAIKASAQLLAEADDESNDAEFLDIIVDEVDRLNRVVSSFLDYARPSQGDPAPTDVNHIVRRTTALLRSEFGDAVQVRLELASGLPKVRIDAEQLRQVLINLSLNAVQAMEGSGDLTISSATRPRTSEGVQRPWVELRVTDTGPGIQERVLANLFVPFVTTKEQGTGLGLAISQKIVNEAGGQIEAKSHRGHGTTFVMSLPAVEQTPDDIKPPTARPRPAAAAMSQAP